MIDDPFNRAQHGPDALEEGHWLIRRRRAGRVDMPVRIFFGPPRDPDTGEELDRSHRWQADICGYSFTGEPLSVGGIVFQDISDFWPACKSEPITAADFRYRVDRQAWAAENDADDPLGRPGSLIDPMTATLPFLD